MTEFTSSRDMEFGRVEVVQTDNGWRWRRPGRKWSRFEFMTQADAYQGASFAHHCGWH